MITYVMAAICSIFFGMANIENNLQQDVKEKVVYIVNGTKVNKKTFNAIDPKTIGEMYVGKEGGELAKSLTGKDDVGVIIVHTKEYAPNPVLDCETAFEEDIKIVGAKSKKKTGKESVFIDEIPHVEIEEKDDNVVMFVDGKEISKKDFDSIDPKTIGEVYVGKEGGELAKSLTGKDDVGVIIVHTKEYAPNPVLNAETAFEEDIKIVSARSEKKSDKE